MERWRDLTEVPTDVGATVVTLGVFDGVHHGHQRVVARTVSRARQHGVPAIVVTFDPHPAAVVRPDAVPPLLTTLEQRLEIFATLGLDAAVVLPFTRERSQQPAEEFVREFVGALHPILVVVGDDFRFGFKAAGDVDLLARQGTELGFGVEGLTRDASNTSWSSTAVRAALGAGDIAGAAKLLGRPHRVDGVVVHGDQRGRGLGVPTANIPADGVLALPADGVYAGWLTEHAGSRARLPAVVSIGTKPQFGTSARVIEAHVLDRADLDLYDQPVGIEFVAWIRGQERFDSIEALVERMRRDIDEARVVVGRTMSERECLGEKTPEGPAAN